MNTRKYYSLRDLSQELNIPKSTIVKYKDYFPEFFVMHGDGKRKKFQDDALDILRTIREFREEKKLDWLEIKDLLHDQFSESAHTAPAEAPAAAPTGALAVAAPDHATAAKIEHLAHMFNALAWEVINIGGQTRRLRQSQAAQAAALAKIENNITRLRRDVEALLLEIIHREDSTKKYLQSNIGEIKAQFTSIQKNIVALANGIKAVSKTDPAQAEAIRALSEKIERIARQPDAGQDKYQALLKENKLLKEKLKQMDQVMHEAPPPRNKGLLGKIFKT
jgi:hypothetical protein